MPFLTSPVLSAGTLAREPQPTLSSDDGLVLRPWRAADAPAVYAAFQDPLMHRFHGKSCASEAEAADWIAEWQELWPGERQAQWAVAEEDGGALLGRVALRQIELGDGTAEIAYWTVARARGRGVAAGATAALTRWAFEEIGFHRLELMHSTANEASCRVALKAGYAAEGTRRSAFLHPDGWHDMHLHARVRGD